ncbi:MAG: hypothetical protein JEZ14_16070 [Marinilabiliaceae bacterium]|nr:hypothetical protein [Marinilabiliaceae bacterium]
MTDTDQLHEATAEKGQSEAEANQTTSAEARSDEQASQTRVAVVLFSGCLEERKGAAKNTKELP